MASGASAVSICNLALSYLGEKPITALSDDSKAARECLRLYEITRDMELAGHNWNFAIRRTNLAADGTDPDWGYDDRYPLPDDCLRVIEVDGSSEWQVEAGNAGESGSTFIVVATSAPTYVRYVSRITDPAVFSVLFIHLLACRLALDMAINLTQSNTVWQACQARYERAETKAKAMNGFEHGLRRRPVGSWQTARY